MYIFKFKMHKCLNVCQCVIFLFRYNKGNHKFTFYKCYGIFEGSCIYLDGDFVLSFGSTIAQT